MSSSSSIEEALAEIAEEPVERWPARVRERFDDPVLAAQALVWLHGGLVDDDKPRLPDARYELGVLLDVGATSSVWQAHDEKLGRDVAVKLFRMERTPVLDEILAEARAACEVMSDHVVRVLDVHADDPAYIVMELVGEYDPRRGTLAPGASAATLRPASIVEAVRWVRDVARGVHDAHLRNVFHRDLKPHNVLITPVSRRARIADFGLAISTNRAGGPQIGGTPSFIAPEQARGLAMHLDPHDLDERALLVGIDVWGLGALAYDLVGGKPPWRGDAQREPWEVAASGDRPPALTNIPARLRRVIDKALALDPHARYATAAELADDLDAYLARMPTTHDRSRARRFALWCRRNPQLTISSLLANALAALALIAYWQASDARAQRNLLAVEAAAAKEDNDVLERRAKEAKAEIAKTESELEASSAALDLMRRTLVDANREYRAIVAAKERALHTADTATHQLADELANTRSERDVALLGRAMYEGFWTRARGDADAATKDRDSAAQERDDARKERDQRAKERDDAVAARAQAEKERDAAVTDRDRAEASRRRAEVDIARLAAELASFQKPGSAAPPDAGAAVSSATADAHPAVSP